MVDKVPLDRGDSHLRIQKLADGTNIMAQFPPEALEKLLIAQSLTVQILLLMSVHKVRMGV